MSRKNKLFAGAVFSVIIAHAVCGCGKKEDVRSRAPESAGASAQAQARDGEFVYDAGENRDPFIHLVSSDGRLLEPQAVKRAREGLYVEGIMYDTSGLSYAVVNAEVVKEGEMVGGYQVVKIEPQRVVFLKDGKELEVELKKEE